MARNSIPERILEDETLAGRFKVKLAEALARRMDESEWKKFAVLHGLSDRIIEHPRFLRSMRWDDPDHEGHVLDLIEYLFDQEPAALMELFERPGVQNWFKSNDAEMLTICKENDDPLITAITHSLQEVEAVSNAIDLTQYTKRIQNALPGDPYQAIGATKDMLEATMRTILHRRDVPDLEKFDFPMLAKRCFAELGLMTSTAPATKGERHLRKIASSAKTMIETANELRNLAGTGHGRVVGNEEVVTAADASLVASSGLVLAAWLLRHDSNLD